MNYDHMIDKHNIWLVPYTEVWLAIKQFAKKTEEERKKKKEFRKTKRSIFLIYWRDMFKQILDHDLEALKALNT